MIVPVAPLHVISRKKIQEATQRLFFLPIFFCGVWMTDVKSTSSYMVLYLQPLIPPKRFDISPPTTEGCSEGLGVL